MYKVVIMKWNIMKPGVKCVPNFSKCGVNTIATAKCEMELNVDSDFKLLINVSIVSCLVPICY